MTQPETHDARDGSGDPTTDPAAAGEARLDAEDADGGAVVDQPTVPEPDTGPAAS